MNPIVGIHAFRHGAGTSTLTAYLALMLAQQGRRVAAIEVQCPGLLREPKDLRLPTYLNVSLPPDILPFHLNPPNSYHAVSVPSNPIGLGHIHLMTFSASVTQHWTLESCSQLLAKILQELDVDYLLIDLPPGMNEFSLMMFGIIDTLVVHLCPEQADFQGTAVITDVAKRLQIPQIAVLLNQVPDIFDPVSLHKQIEDLYQLPLLGYLPFVPEIRIGLPYQTFPLFKRRDSFRVALDRIALRLQTLEDKPPIAETNLEAPPAASQVTLLDILMLPDAERQLTNWLIYRGPVEASDVAQHLNTSMSVALTVLDKLLSQGIVEEVTEEGKTYYRSTIEPPSA
jgi:MinD-like ATPase involved in chromosome partitioning or flagellar assembly